MINKFKLQKWMLGNKKWTEYIILNAIKFLLSQYFSCFSTEEFYSSEEMNGVFLFGKVDFIQFFI